MSEQDQPPAPEAKGQLEREAAEWCVRLHGPDAADHRQTFEEWLRRGALHRQAYNRIEEVYVLGGRLRRRESAIAGEEEPSSLSQPSSRGWKRMVAFVATMALVSGVGTYFVTTHGSENAVALQRATGTRLSTSATPETFTLADGSQVQLGPGSSIAVAFGPSRRDVLLDAGRARFRVHHDGRSFVVTARGGTITAVGTVFDVQLASDHVLVRLLEGRVDVKTPNLRHTGTMAMIRHLMAGQEVAYDAGTPARTEKPAQLAATSDQPRTVGELIERTNAASNDGLRVELADPTLSAVALSGAFRVHDPATTAERLALMLDLTIDRTTPGVLVLRRQPAR